MKVYVTKMLSENVYVFFHYSSIHPLLTSTPSYVLWIDLDAFQPIYLYHYNHIFSHPLSWGLDYPECFTEVCHGSELPFAFWSGESIYLHISTVYNCAAHAQVVMACFYNGSFRLTPFQRYSALGGI